MCSFQKKSLTSNKIYLKIRLRIFEALITPISLDTALRYCITLDSKNSWKNNKKDRNFPFEYILMKIGPMGPVVAVHSPRAVEIRLPQYAHGHIHPVIHPMYLKLATKRARRWLRPIGLFCASLDHGSPISNGSSSLACVLIVAQSTTVSMWHARTVARNLNIETGV